MRAITWLGIFFITIAFWVMVGMFLAKYLKEVL